MISKPLKPLAAFSAEWCETSAGQGAGQQTAGPGICWAWGMRTPGETRLSSCCPIHFHPVHMYLKGLCFPLLSVSSMLFHFFLLSHFKIPHFILFFLLPLLFSPSFVTLFCFLSPLLFPLCSSFSSLPFHSYSTSPFPQHPKTAASLLTRNAPTQASNISCDRTGGSGSPCVRTSPWVRPRTSMIHCCTTSGRGYSPAWPL